MKTSNYRGVGRGRFAVGVLLALSGATLCASASADAQFEPYLGADLMWVDNLDLAAPGEVKQEDYVAQIAPGLRLRQQSKRLKSYLDYRLQALFYDESNDRNQVFHNAALSADLTAIEDWFFVGMDGSYFQSVVDPTRPVNTNNLFNVGNTADTATGRITPELKHRFRAAQLDAAYSYAVVDYRKSSDPAAVLDDSRNQNAFAQLSSVDEEALLTWLARYEYQHAEYDIALPFTYERAVGELGIRLVQGLRLIGRGGVESDPFLVPEQGGLDESFWAGGFEWHRGRNFELRVLRGERFFGTTWEALMRMKGRILQFEVGYDETPTTQTQQIAMRNVQAPDPAQPVPPLPPEASIFGRATSEIYLLRRGHAQVAAVGRLTRIGLDYVDEEREYVLLGGVRDDFRSGRLFVNRQFGQRTFGEVSASLVDSDLREGGSYRDEIYTLMLTREIGMRTTLSLSGHHLSRTGDLEEYDANWVSLGLQMTF